MIRHRIVVKIAAVMALCVTAFSVAGRVCAAPRAGEKDAREHAGAGLDLLMNGDPDGAIEFFRQIQIRDPQSPLGYLLEGDAVWWKIYYATGDLIAPDVFDVVSSQTTPYDSHFEDLVSIALRKSAALRAAPQDDARTWLYEALAYALRARLDGLRGKELSTARAGRRMRRTALTVLRLDPSLADAYLAAAQTDLARETVKKELQLLSSDTVDDEEMRKAIRGWAEEKLKQLGEKP